MESNSYSGFPRKISDGIYWIGYCGASNIGGSTFHVHFGLYLLVGSEKTLLVDTGTPSNWTELRQQLDQVLGDRPIDYIMPTHPEVPHCSGLPLLLNRYPDAVVVGDMTDYDLYFPNFVHRLRPMEVGERIDLGGLDFELVEAVIKDLPNTMWGYSRQRKTLFVSDGFAFAHDIPGVSEPDEPLHLPGNCSKMSSELDGGVNVKQASFIVRAALHWTRFVEPSGTFAKIDELLEKYPARIICPAHGNVIDDLESVYPIIRDVHKAAFNTAMAGNYSFGG